MKKQHYKFLVTGPVNAGKTQFIKTISEIEVITTDEITTDETSFIKKETTVAMDFGRLTISDEIVLYLFGTPGQKRFSFMWDVLSENCLGIIFLVDSRDRESMHLLREVVEYYEDKLYVPRVIAYTHIDLPGSLPEEEIKKEVGIDWIPYLPCNAKNYDDVLNVLIFLLDMLLESEANELENDDYEDSKEIMSVG